MSDLELGKKRAKELGLSYRAATLSYDQAGGQANIYFANDIHRLLGAGVETYTKSATNSNFSNFNIVRLADDDMVALQIGIRPIAQESEERKLLKEIVDHLAPSIGPDLFDRARKLLERK